MKHSLIPALLAIAIVIASCTKDNEAHLSSPGGLVGCWINPVYDDSVIIYERAASFTEGPGIVFYDDGRLIERKNAGFCGTPPITYADYDGSYTVNDSVIDVTVSYWGGTTGFALKLISVNDGHLTVKWLNGD